MPDGTDGRKELFEESLLGRTLKALSNGDRFEIMLMILDGETNTFNTLKERLGMSKGNLAHHIKLMKEAGLFIERGNLSDKRSHFYIPTPYARRVVTGLFDAMKRPTQNVRYDDFSTAKDWKEGVDMVEGSQSSFAFTSNINYSKETLREDSIAAG